MSNICFIDFETTGLYPEIHSPLQLGAVLMDNKTHQIRDQISQYILPPVGCVVDDRAMEVSGLDIKNMPEGSENQAWCLYDFFKKFGHDYRFAAWNTHFDVAFFRGMCVRVGLIDAYNKIDYHHIDVQSIVQFLRLRGSIPRGITSFNNILEWFGLKRSNQKHDALEDAILLKDVYICLESMF